jgi:hypothetical protein
MVRELVSRKGRTAVTLRFRSLAESEPGDTECSLALDCATLLLGATAVEATWLAASAAPGDLLLQGEGQGCWEACSWYWPGHATAGSESLLYRASIARFSPAQTGLLPSKAVLLPSQACSTNASHQPW